MEELPLTDELINNISDWMEPRYSINTKKQYLNLLKSIAIKYKVLNKNNLIKITKKFRYQNQRAVLCVINDYCYDNDIDYVIRVPKLKAPPKKTPQLLSDSEIRLIIKSAPKPYDLAIRCIFNIGAGLRVSEIIKLSWDDIRWIDWLENKDNYGIVTIKSGKGSKDRVINIPTKLMQDLYEYAQMQETTNEFGVPCGGMIFDFGYSEMNNKKKKAFNDMLSYDLERAKNDYVKKRYDWFRYHILEKCCEKALGKKIKIHSLRHSRATYLYEVEKVPVEKIQMLLGHSSLNTTMLYTRINPISVFELIKDTKEV